VLLVAALVVAPSVGSLGSTAPVIARDAIATPAWAEQAREAHGERGPVRVFRPVSLYEDDANASLRDAIATLTGTSAARHGIATAGSSDPARPEVHDRIWLAASSAGGALLERYAIPLAILPRSMVSGRHLVELARRGNWALVRYPASPRAAM